MIYAWGGCEIDEERHELRRDGDRIAVQPKVFAVLLHLVRNRARAVSKKELLAQVWPGETVGRTSLTRAINAARAALGDDGDQQAAIRTVRGMGYRLVAAVSERRSAREGVTRVAVAPGTTPFVGREELLTALEALLEELSAGRGALALLCGPAGIGKTRTLSELAERAAAAGVAVLAGSCVEDRGAPPFWPWISVLRALSRSRSRDDLRRVVGPGSADLVQAMPALAEHLPELPESPAIDPPQRRFRLHESVAAALRRASEVTPLLVVIDDLHAADLSSLDLLEHVARALRDSPVLLVGAHREVDSDSGVSRALARLSRPARTFELSGLSSAELARWLELSTGRAPDTAEVATLRERTGGNPLFVSQIFASHAVGGPPPRGVRQEIQRQLERFSARARSALLHAAALGREFALGPLSAATRRSPAALLGDLGDAIRDRIVAEIPDSVGRYRFAHGLFGEVLLAELSVAERARLHGRVAAALVTHHGERAESHVEEIAHHFLRAAPGGDAAAGVEWCVRAGERALERTAFEQAAQHFENALESLDLTRAEPVRRAELLLRAGEAHALAGNLEAARERFRRGAAIAGALGNDALLVRAALGMQNRDETGRVDAEGVALLEEALALVGLENTSVRARLLGMLAKSLYFGDSQERSIELARQAVEVARSSQDAAALASVLRDLSFVLSGPDESRERARTLREIGALARTSHDRELHCYLWRERVRARLERGERKSLEQAIEAHERLGAELRQPYFVWYAHEHRAMLALLRGELARAETLSNEALRYGARIQPDLAFQWNGVRRCILLRELGRGEELVEPLRKIIGAFPGVITWRAVAALLDLDAGRLDRARDAVRSLVSHELSAIPRNTNWLITLAILGELCGSLGDADLAAPLYPALLAHADRHVAIGLSIASYGSVARYLGLVAKAIGDLDAAAEHLAHAVESNESAGALAWAAHVRQELAEALLARGASGDRRQALELSTRARSDAESLGMGVVARRARELEDELLRPIPIRSRA